MESIIKIFVNPRILGKKVGLYSLILLKIENSLNKFKPRIFKLRLRHALIILTYTILL